MNTVEILKSARSLIADESRWVRGHYAATAGKDRAIGPNEKNAHCFCAIGAIAKVMNVSGGDAEESDAAIKLSNAAGFYYGWDVPEFNDNHEHAEVLALFDKAIAEAGAA